MAGRKLRIGLSGLGRMGICFLAMLLEISVEAYRNYTTGQRHAMNFYGLTPRADVVAASEPDAAGREWAAENLDGVQVYSDYDEMLEKADIQAVVIVSITAVHAEQTIKAIEKGYHVLCEKPLSININIAQSVVDAHKKALKTHPNQKVMCAFSRRFDASYRDAYQKMVNGEYGRSVIFRSQTADLYDDSGKFVEYAKTSGGIFLDCSIHDIDLMLWFFGEDCKLKSVHAVGVTAVHHGLNSTKDSDNAIATIEFQGGRIAALYCSRMMAAGQEDTTEIICERGSLKVNMQGRKNHVDIHDSYGSRRELPQHYYERFREAFVTEASEFTDCCLDNKPTPVPLQSSVKAVAIGQALQQSLITGEKIVFNKSSL